MVLLQSAQGHAVAHVTSASGGLRDMKDTLRGGSALFGSFWRSRDSAEPISDCLEKFSQLAVFLFV